MYRWPQTTQIDDHCGRKVTRNIVKCTPFGNDAAAKRVLELLAEAASASTVLVPTAVSVVEMAASVDR